MKQINLTEDEEWLTFKAGFMAAKDFYNKELAGKRKWILLPDKSIGNAYWRHKNPAHKNK